MANKPMKISEEAAVQMPMKTVASLIAIIAIGTWAYFGIHEKLNQHSTQLELMYKDLEQNTEFRIKYPRGELGQSAGEADCLKSKRIAQNEVNPERVVFTCKKVKAKTEIYMDRKKILSIIE